MVFTNCKNQTFYISNSYLGSSCDLEDVVLHPCTTLEKLAKNGILRKQKKISIYVYFIHNNYTISKNVALVFPYLNVTEVRPWKRKNRVSVLCVGDLTFTYKGAKMLKFENLKFDQCGKSKPVITLGKYTKNGYGSVTITNTAFINIKENSLRIKDVLHKLEIKNCSFDGGMRDYAVYFKSQNNKSSFINTAFRNNAGGGIYFSSNSSLSFKTCTFINNSRGHHGSGSAVLIQNVTSFHIDHCNFYHNRQSAVVIQQSPCKVSVTNCDFTNNSAHDREKGGGLFIRNNNVKIIRLEIDSSQFLFNNAECGGAFAAQNVGNILLRNSSFYGNEAIELGGAIFVDHNMTLGINSFNFQACFDTRRILL